MQCPIITIGIEEILFLLGKVLYMKLLLNGQELDNIQPEPETLGAALFAIQDNHITDDQVISTIHVDGEPLTAELLAEWKNRSLDDFDEAHIEAIKRNQLAARGLRILIEGLAESKNDRDEIVDHLCQGRSTQAMTMLNGYLQIWNGAQQSLLSAGRLLEVDFETIEIYYPDSESGEHKVGSLKDVLDSLTDNLTEIKSALEAQDMVLLGDILEYEFGSMTENWQDMLVQLADRFDNEN